ncbi:hypothetical protein FA15DRAFT_681689 [Coprinopsis marcescibilis]|uniref:MYND-type domain-containing protein n=1 Tax=Coprinopsis marcescibilis TaxID=230819 RepID=A0A5C3KPG0_COPMA|nr:hypothetical protein FA15DRAFT_681689 [Coprinopsis marcescibilis]
MPGPGQGNKGSKKRKATTSSKGSTGGKLSQQRDNYVDDIEGADGWTGIVSILCGVFQLPDLATRRGLKKVHTNFNAIYTKLDAAYQTYSDNEKITGGIVGIYSKMSRDSLLRNKLYERGFLDKLMPLIYKESTRRMALRALVTVTHHGGAEIRAKIATHCNTLTNLLSTYASDEDICEMVVSIITHAVGAVTEGPESSCAFPKILKTLDMSTMLKLVVQATKQHPQSAALFEHATEFIASSSLHATKAFASVPEAVRYLVAGMRCPDWIMRCYCIGGLTRLHRWESEDDQRILDPKKLISAIQRGIPPHLNDRLISYGPARCELYLSLRTTNEFQNALMQCVQDHDLYALGLKLHKIILQTEFSISEGYYETVNERTGKREMMNVGLPFDRWSDALPICADVLRKRGKREDADAADILDIKFKIMRAKVDQAAKQAEEALKRSPDCAYFYYAISLSADHIAGLRASKKGIKCKNITPFRAVEHAGELGTGEHKWEEGIAFLMSSYEDAKVFLEQAPPDNRYMKNVSYWYILLTILIGDKLSPDLHELQDGLSKLKFADECSKLMGVTPPRTFMRLTQEKVIKLLPESMKEFEHVFNRKNTDGHGPKTKDVNDYDDLSVWLDKVVLEDGEVEGPPVHGHGGGDVGAYKVNPSKFELYRCSYCGNPSAALKKCSGCGKSRYCDSTCQKTHWYTFIDMCAAFVIYP